MRRFDGESVELIFVLQCEVAVPMLLAPVDDDPEKMERELMGLEEVPPSVVIEVPAPGESTSEERKHHGLTSHTCHILVQRLRPSLWEKKRRHHKSSQQHQSSDVTSVP